MEKIKRVKSKSGKVYEYKYQYNKGQYVKKSISKDDNLIRNGRINRKAYAKYANENNISKENQKKFLKDVEKARKTGFVGFNEMSIRQAVSASFSVPRSYEKMLFNLGGEGNLPNGITKEMFCNPANWKGSQFIHPITGDVYEVNENYEEGDILELVATNNKQTDNMPGSDNKDDNFKNKINAIKVLDNIPDDILNSLFANTKIINEFHELTDDLTFDYSAEEGMKFAKSMRKIANLTHDMLSKYYPNYKDFSKQTMNDMEFKFGQFISELSPAEAIRVASNRMSSKELRNIVAKYREKYLKNK